MDTETEAQPDIEVTQAHVEVPDGAVVAREIRIIEYRDEVTGATGLAIGVWDEISYDMIRSLGMISMSGVMLAREQGA